MIASLALKNAKKYWRKSLAAILAISSSFVAQTLFVGYLENVEQLFEAILSDKEMFGDVIIENKNRFTVEGKDNPLKYSVTEEEIAQIQSWADGHSDLIDAQVKTLIFSGVISNGKTQLVAMGRGFSLDSSKTMRGNFDWNAKYGQPLENEGTPGAALLGVTLGSWMGCIPEKVAHLRSDLDGYPKVLRPFICDEYNLQLTTLTENSQINGVDISVHGLIDGGLKDVDSRLVLTDLETVQKLLDTKKISYWTFKWKNPNDKNKNNSLLQQHFAQANPNLHVIDWKQHRAGDVYNESMSLLNVFRYFVTIIVLTITGLSVFNTSLKSVIERTREIGALLSIGFSRSQISKLFIMEAAYLGIIGNIIGFFAAILLTAIINAIGIEYKAGIYSEGALFEIQPVAQAYLSAAFITISVCVFTTYFTLRRFLSRRIVQNLNG
jgi:hypothetical protein